MARQHTSYQRRMTRLVWASNFYLIAAPIALFFAEVSKLAWLIYVSTALITYCMAVAADAIFDSLSERLPPRPDPEDTD